MKNKNEIKKIKEKILYLEKKIKIVPNSCQRVHTENILSLENDKKYLEILKNKLKNILNKKENIFCVECGKKIESQRLKIIPETNYCSKCKK